MVSGSTGSSTNSEKRELWGEYGDFYILPIKIFDVKQESQENIQTGIQWNAVFIRGDFYPS